MIEVKRGRGRPKGGGKRALAITPEMVDALRAKLVVVGDCHVFTGTVTPSGYGAFYFDSIIQGSAHRVAYEMWKGDIPKGGYVIPSCGNKLCCNPDHLTLGTFKDVMRIRNEAGRSIRGTRNPKAKLNLEQVQNIRDRLAAGIKPRILAAEFDISQSTISQIKQGKTWGTFEHS